MSKSPEEVQKILTESRRSFSQGEEGLLAGIVRIDSWKLTIIGASTLCIILLTTLLGYIGKKPIYVDFAKNKEQYKVAQKPSASNQQQEVTTVEKQLSAVEEDGIEKVIASLNAKKQSIAKKDIPGACSLNCLNGKYALELFPALGCACDYVKNQMSSIHCCITEEKWSPNDIFAYLQ